MNTTRAGLRAVLLTALGMIVPVVSLGQTNESQWWWSKGLGFYSTTINDALSKDLNLPRNRGLLVIAVARNSASSAAGLQPGDIVESWTPEELWSTAGKTGSIQVLRNGQTQTLSVQSGTVADDAVSELIRRPLDARAEMTFVVDQQGGGDFRTVTAAMFRAQPSDTIVIKSGSYNEAVFVTPGVKVRAPEKLLTRIESKGAWLLLGNGGVEFSQLVFSGSQLFIQNSDHVTISDCDFVPAEKQTALVVGNSKNVDVKKSSFRGTSTTVGISSISSTMTISDSLFMRNGTAAIRVALQSDVQLNNNFLDANAVGVAADDARLVATHNVLTGDWKPETKSDNLDVGFRLEKVTAELNNNVIRRHRYGILASDSTETIKVIESTVTQGEYGIALIGSPGLLRDNLVMQNLRTGIYVGSREKEPQPKPQEVSIVRNTISANEGDAIEVLKFSKVTISENLIEGNAGGVDLTDAVAAIENNTVVMQRFSGIRLSGQSESRIFNNIVAFNSFGMFVDVASRWESGYNDVHGNLASTEFPLRDGNYGRADRYVTRDGKKIPIDIYPAYDLRSPTDIDVEPGFVKAGSDYNLSASSPLASVRGKDGRYIGAYSPASFSTPVATATTMPRTRRRRPSPTRIAPVVEANPSRTRAYAFADAKALVETGDQYMKVGKWKDAVAAYEQATQVGAGYAPAHNALGWAFNRMGEHGRAFAPLVKAIQLDPQLADAHYGIAYAYLATENYAKAFGFLKTTVRIDPKNADARFSLGEIYLELNDKKGALEQYEALKGLNQGLADELLGEINETP